MGRDFTKGVQEILAAQRGPEEPVRLVMAIRCHDPAEASAVEAAVRRCVEDRGWLSEVESGVSFPLAGPQVPGGFQP